MSLYCFFTLFITLHASEETKQGTVFGPVNLCVCPAITEKLLIRNSCNLVAICVMMTSGSD